MANSLNMPVGMGDVSYDYEIHDKNIKVTVSRKLGPIIGMVDQRSLKPKEISSRNILDKEFISKIFLDAITAQESS